MTQRVVDYTYGTGNSVLPNGSIDVRDGIDNLQSFDIFMNAPEDTYNQRDGEIVRTVAGMNNEFDAQILNMGFTRIGTFAAGATLTNPRQTLLWDVADGGDGQEYGWSGAFPQSGKVIPPGSTPMTTGGIAVGAWMSRFDPALRVQTRESLRRSYAEAGYNLVAGSFEVGGTLVNANDVLLHKVNGIAYSWDGTLPITVAPNQTPTPIGSGGWIDRSDVALRSELSSNSGAMLIGGLPFVSPLHFGATPGAAVDATAAIKSAISKSVATGWPLDLRGGPWIFSEQLDLTGVSMVICDYHSELVCNPTGFTAPTVSGRKFAITFGVDDGSPHTGRCVGVSVVGSLVVRSLNRITALDGVFIKGSFINAGHIRAVNFNGHGVYRDSVWDSTFQRVSVELCGNTSKFAYWHASNGDTSNASHTVSLQVEQAYHKGFYIDAIRDVINNVHAERLYQLTANDGSSNIDGSTWLNSHIVLSNSCLTQLICDSASVNPPTGESIVAGQTYRISFGGVNLTAGSIAVAGSVLTSYGSEITISGLNCSDFISNAPAKNITLNEPNIVTVSVENKLTVNGGSIYNARAQYSASNHSYNNVTIDNVAYSNSIKGDIDFNSCAIRIIGATLNATDPTKMSVEFNNCTIQEFAGANGQRANVRGGYVLVANIADNAEVWFIDTTIGTFNPLGNVRYITRGVTATTVTSWDYPRTRNYPAGTLTERVGYSAAGKLYQNTDSALTWAKIA